MFQMRACVRALFCELERGANAGLDLQRSLRSCCLAAQKGLGETLGISWEGDDDCLVSELLRWKRDDEMIDGAVCCCAASRKAVWKQEI